MTFYKGWFFNRISASMFPFSSILIDLKWLCKEAQSQSMNWRHDIDIFIQLISSKNVMKCSM